MTDWMAEYLRESGGGGRNSPGLRSRKQKVEKPGPGMVRKGAGGWKKAEVVRENLRVGAGTFGIDNVAPPPMPSTIPPPTPVTSLKVARRRNPGDSQRPQTSGRAVPALPMRNKKVIIRGQGDLMDAKAVTSGLTPSVIRPHTTSPTQRPWTALWDEEQNQKAVENSRKRSPSPPHRQGAMTPAGQMMRMRRALERQKQEHVRRAQTADPEVFALSPHKRLNPAGIEFDGWDSAAGFSPSKADSPVRNFDDLFLPPQEVAIQGSGMLNMNDSEYVPNHLKRPQTTKRLNFSGVDSQQSNYVNTLMASLDPSDHALPVIKVTPQTEGGIEDAMMEDQEKKITTRLPPGHGKAEGSVNEIAVLPLPESARRGSAKSRPSTPGASQIGTGRGSEGSTSRRPQTPGLATSRQIEKENDTGSRPATGGSRKTGVMFSGENWEEVSKSKARSRPATGESRASMRPPTGGSVRSGGSQKSSRHGREAGGEVQKAAESQTGTRAPTPALSEKDSIQGEVILAESASRVNSSTGVGGVDKSSPAPPVLAEPPPPPKYDASEPVEKLLESPAFIPAGTVGATSMASIDPEGVYLMSPYRAPNLLKPRHDPPKDAIPIRPVRLILDHNEETRWQMEAKLEEAKTIVAYALKKIPEKSQIAIDDFRRAREILQSNFTLMECGITSFTNAFLVDTEGRIVALHHHLDICRLIMHSMQATCETIFNLAKQLIASSKNESEVLDMLDYALVLLTRLIGKDVKAYFEGLHRRSQRVYNNCLRMRGQLLRSQGRLEEAVEDYAVLINRLHEYPNHQSTLLIAMATMYNEIGRSLYSEKCLKRAVDICEMKGISPDALCESRLALGNYYADHGIYEAAMKYAKMARQICRDSWDDREIECLFLMVKCKLHNNDVDSVHSWMEGLVNIFKARHWNRKLITPAMAAASGLPLSEIDFSKRLPSLPPVSNEKGRELVNLMALYIQKRIKFHVGTKKERIMFAWELLTAFKKHLPHIVTQAWCVVTVKNLQNMEKL